MGKSTQNQWERGRRPKPCQVSVWFRWCVLEVVAGVVVASPRLGVVAPLEVVVGHPWCYPWAFVVAIL